ncbi:MAG: 50S ribosomal protein L11 methyltransferase [Lachnospiraceae bacterium]|nr:50S ribosomal protein L11 methyltransferase [Lachnospiraceae bacterium]
MKWKKISVKTTAENEGLIADMLLEKGFEGVEVCDNKQLSAADVKKMFIDILPELDENDDTAFVNCYVDVDSDMDEKLALVNEGLTELSFFIDTDNVTVTVSETEDKDWMNNWKEFFKPFRIDDSIVVKPTWETSSEKKPGDIEILIDPGTAFGTGAHETTKLCILALKKYMKAGDKVLDLGCGSGILSVASMLLGASGTVGTDIDPIAVSTSVENSGVNGIKAEIGENYTPGMSLFSEGNVINDSALRARLGLKFYDVVVANILADIIMPLSDVVADFMNDNSMFISSGILAVREKEVTDRLHSNGFEIVDVLRMGDWVSLVAKKA